MADKKVIAYEATDIIVLEDEKSFFVESLAVTDKYVHKNLIEPINKYAVNTPMLYRHSHPTKGTGGQIAGRVVESKIVDLEDGHRGVWIKSKIFDKTEFQRTLRTYIKEKQEAKDPIKISVGFTQSYDKERVPIDAQVYEFSYTHLPVCTECITEDVYKMEDADLIKLEGKIGELQGLLDIESGKTKELEASITEKDTKLKEYEEKFTNQKTGFETLVKQLETDFNKKLRHAEIKPTVDKICELEEDTEFRDMYFGYTDEKLEARLKKVQKKFTSSVITQTMDEASTIALEATQADEWRAAKIKELENQPDSETKTIMLEMLIKGE